MKKRTKSKTCYKCKKKIKEKEHHIDLITNVDGKVYNAYYFHILCWGEFNQEKVNERIKQMSGLGMDMIKNIIGEK
jgi:hypothetical protein